MKVISTEVLRETGGMCLGVHDVSFDDVRECLRVTCDDGSVIGVHACRNLMPGSRRSRPTESSPGIGRKPDAHNSLPPQGIRKSGGPMVLWYLSDTKKESPYTELRKLKRRARRTDESASLNEGRKSKNYDHYAKYAGHVGTGIIRSAEIAA